MGKAGFRSKGKGEKWNEKKKGRKQMDRESGICGESWSGEKVDEREEHVATQQCVLIDVL